MQPTLEQRNIIEYTEGHCLVFAVAGSGKTATMVQRILHLVQHHQIRPTRILACTFSREAARTIEKRLAQYPETDGVRVGTLHALASLILQEARRMGLTRLQRGEDHFSRRLFADARQQLIDENPDEKNAYYNIKYDDFQTYISVQKGNLQLPYVPDDLPDWARSLITEPDRGVDLYADLFDRHDALRRTEGKIDFDDSIVEAFLLMARFPALHEVIANKWDYVHVDEFQDVNLAQNEMMGLVAGNCRSYTAIGDDDQTIYQWRGADPRFILGFAERYRAKIFTLSTNFRCPMGVIALADEVVQKNTIRAAKHLRASRGGNGVFLHEHDIGKAAHVAIRAIQEGRDASEIVILVRTYAQTGEIEQVFLEKDIPYLVVGGVPFYHRHEVAVLLAYLRLALADLEMLNGISPTAEQRLQLIKDWKMVVNAPSLYLRTPVVDQVGRRLWHQGLTLADALAQLTPDLRPNVAANVTNLSLALSNLTDDLALSRGKEALLGFADAIGYTDHLIKTAPTREFGEERAGSVRALAEMAAERSLGELVTYITYLSKQARYAEKLSEAEDDGLARVTIMTVYRSKGLEFPMVIVPDCKDSLYRIKEGADTAAAEEERRVFYVALTRAKEELHLVVDSTDPTKFLTSVGHERVVQAHTRLNALLPRPASTWTARETSEVATLLRTYGHEQYVQLWLKPEVRKSLLQRIDALRTALLNHQEKFEGQQETIAELGSERYSQFGEVPPAGSQGDFNDLEHLVKQLSVRYKTVMQPSTPGMTQQADGTALRPEDMVQGMTVKHRKFGVGQVMALRGRGDRMEAEVNFPSLDAPKRLLVKFANLHRADAVAAQGPSHPVPSSPYLLREVTEDEVLPF